MSKGGQEDTLLYVRCQVWWTHLVGIDVIKIDSDGRVQDQGRRYGHILDPSGNGFLKIVRHVEFGVTTCNTNVVTFTLN